MKQRIRAFIFLFAVTAIALPHCATNRAAEPARVEPAKAEPARAGIESEAPSAPIGSVYRLDAGTREVLVRTKRILKMGERVYAEVGDGKAMMEATFPMMTSSKCTLEASSRKYFRQLAKGMPVYAYVPGERKAVRAEPKAGDTKTIGGMEFVYIPAGSFMMGSHYDWEGGDEHPRHQVTVDGFWMGRYEVTQGQYKAVMGTNPSFFKGDGRRPVERVSWYDAVEFCNRLSKKAGLAPCYTIDRTRRDPNNLSSYDDKMWTVTLNVGANGFRLPTEAEWEYAARAGSETRYYWGDNLLDACCYANVADRAAKQKYSWEIIDCNDGYVETAPVGRFGPNRWGLYDMAGNVWEWCEDWYDGKYYARSPEKNPKGPESGQTRVLRGGSWGADVNNGRSANRDRHDPVSRYGGWLYNNGFRVVVPAGKK